MGCGNDDGQCTAEDLGGCYPGVHCGSQSSSAPFSRNLPSGPSTTFEENLPLAPLSYGPVEIRETVSVSATREDSFPAVQIHRRVWCL